MPAVKVVNFNVQDSRDAGEMELTDAVFGVAPHMAAMHQVVVAHLANCRQGTSSAKTRGDVSGGGKKPWRQRHTGRARQGSTRSPLWIHGGVAHGPKVRDYHQKVNKKVRRLALLSALSIKVRDGQMLVARGMELEKPSTKAMATFMKDIGAQKALVVYHAGGAVSDGIVRSARNVPGTKCINVASINVYDLLNSKTLIVTPEVVARLEEVYAK